LNKIFKARGQSDEIVVQANKSFEEISDGVSTEW